MKERMMEINEIMIREALDAAGVDESAVHTAYAGRGSYGRTCFGFVGSTRDLCRFFIALVSEASYDEDALVERVDLADDLADAVQSDRLGFDTIFYFPGFTLV